MKQLIKHGLGFVMWYVFWWVLAIIILFIVYGNGRTPMGPGY